MEPLKQWPVLLKIDSYRFLVGCPSFRAVRCRVRTYQGPGVGCPAIKLVRQPSRVRLKRHKLKRFGESLEYSYRRDYSTNARRVKDFFCPINAFSLESLISQGFKTQNIFAKRQHKSLQAGLRCRQTTPILSGCCRRMAHKSVMSA